MDDEAGTIGTLRYRLGHESGDVFEEDDNFDGLTLTVEVPDVAEGIRMVEALRREVFGRFSGEIWHDLVPGQRRPTFPVLIQHYARASEVNIMRAIFGEEPEHEPLVSIAVWRRGEWRCPTRGSIFKGVTKWMRIPEPQPPAQEG